MNKKGLTLIELLIVMVISSILIAGIYRTFIGQQHTYTVQEQVVDMQQNVRIAINQMVREIRMAGFGRGAIGMHGGYKWAIKPINQALQIVGASQEITTLTANAPSGTDKILVNNASDFSTGGGLQYISINGTESQEIKKIVDNEIELSKPLLENHFMNEPVFRILKITYSIGVVDGKSVLLRDDNITGNQPLAENIESLSFRYMLQGETTYRDTVPGNLRKDIRMVEVTIRARTDRNDPELGGGGDGFRRRTLTSNIQLRNIASLWEGDGSE